MSEYMNNESWEEYFSSVWIEGEQVCAAEDLACIVGHASGLGVRFLCVDMLVSSKMRFLTSAFIILRQVYLILFFIGQVLC